MCCAQEGGKFAVSVIDGSQMGSKSASSLAAPVMPAAKATTKKSTENKKTTENANKTTVVSLLVNHSLLLQHLSCAVPCLTVNSFVGDLSLTLIVSELFEYPTE
jgi:hypothetical protein